mgnify:CR=1 FL=1
MKELTTYLVESLVCGGVLYACYRLLLDRRVAFGWCRGWLLALPLLAAVIPLLRIPLYPGEVIRLTAGPALPTWESAATETAAVTMAEAEPLTAADIALWLYAAGVVVTLGASIAQLWHIRQLGRGASVTRTGRITLVRTQQQSASFSFFGRVYVWEQLPDRELEAVLLHEASHIRRRHSLERLAMELLKAALWWNPFVWLAARRLVEVEEYEADSDVLASGYAINRYVDTLFMQLFGYSPEIANGLRSSLTKKRLKMMTSQPPSRHARLRLAATLPFIIGLFCAFAFTSRAAVILPAETAEKTAAHASTPVATAETHATAATPENIPADAAGHAAENTLQQPAAAAQEAAPSEKSCRVHLTVALRNFSEDGKQFTMKRAAAGVIVRVKDSTLGTVTDEKGVAELTVPQGCLLEVSCIGYETLLVDVPREERFSQSVMLDNSADDTRDEARQPQQAQQAQQEGKPLVITFRDKDGVAGTPLYMVDGVETEINEIPTNIGSVTFIHAEDAVKRYGEERGRFGALEITTLTLQEMARETEEPPFIVAETMPSFEGGDLLKFREWLQSEVRYPAEALKQRIEGRVVCSFVIERDGSVSNITALQSPDRLLTNEVRRVLANSPRWSPGMQKGETVRVKYIVPVDFSLPKQSEAATGAGTPAAGQTDGPAAEEDAPVTLAETMPSFQGGDLTTFRQWLQTQVRYPAEALKEKAGGLVVCSFVVERDGSISNAETLQSPSRQLSTEVERIIKASSSHWQPGRDKGKAVRVKLVLPVKFAIMGSKEPSQAKTPAPEGSVETLQVVGFAPEQ